MIFNQIGLQAADFDHFPVGACNPIHTTYSDEVLNSGKRDFSGFAQGKSAPRLHQSAISFGAGVSITEMGKQ